MTQRTKLKEEEEEGFDGMFSIIFLKECRWSLSMKRQHSIPNVLEWLGLEKDFNLVRTQFLT